MDFNEYIKNKLGDNMNLIESANQKLEKLQQLNETGEMSKYDIEKGGEDYEWAKSIQERVEELCSQTDKVKFFEMRPFDKYQGPYAYVEINGKGDRIWGFGKGDMELYIEDLDIAGTPDLLADAINGERTANRIASENVERGRNK